MLTLTHISHHFGDTRALDDVSLEVAAGEVHALLGENGAGKSTMVRIAAGLLDPTAGTVRVGDGTHLPVGVVHQHFTAIPAFTVAENVALAAGWNEHGARLVARARAVIDRIGLPLDPEAPVESLSVQLRQRLEVVKAMAGDAKLLLLDEPSAVLAPREATELFRMVRRFVDHGGGVLLVTHKLSEVFAVADRVTVLRQGRVVRSAPVSGETQDTLARTMLGGEVVREPRPEATPGTLMVRLSELVLERNRGGVTAPISLECRVGEIVGVAAIEGNGQRELLRAIVGLEEVNILSGSRELVGSIGFVPEDRTTEGIIPALSVTENLMLTRDSTSGFWIDWSAQAEQAEQLVQRFDVRGAEAATLAGALSGGNQQKLIFARVLSRNPKVLVVEDPTRGLDVQAAANIHAHLRAAAAEGATVIVHSSDLDEVLALADRIVVLCQGVLTELHAGATRDDIGDAMLGIVAR